MRSKNTSGHRALGSRVLATLVLVLGGALDARPQVPALDARSALGLSGPRPVVTILGTHHLANPNLDAVKTGFDDPRSPKRQAEINDLVERLKRFQPTKVAVEAPYGSTAVQERYQRYLRGDYELTANEVDQIGFRLAKELGHRTVYPIDYRMGLDLEGPMKFGAANGQSDKVAAMQRGFGAIGQLLADAGKGPLLEMYRLQNNPSVLGEGHAFYVYLAEFGKDSLYPGADQLSRWYERNAKIAANIIRTASSPSDRVFVLIGSGHAYLLNEILSHSPSVELVWSEKFLR